MYIPYCTVNDRLQVDGTEEIAIEADIIASLHLNSLGIHHTSTGPGATPLSTIPADFVQCCRGIIGRFGTQTILISYQLTISIAWVVCLGSCSLPPNFSIQLSVDL